MSRSGEETIYCPIDRCSSNDAGICSAQSFNGLNVATLGPLGFTQDTGYFAQAGMPVLGFFREGKPESTQIGTPRWTSWEACPHLHKFQV